MAARIELTLLPHRENYCPNAIDTYGGIYKDGTMAQGGYSSHIRAHEYFTFKASGTFRTSFVMARLIVPALTRFLTILSPRLLLLCCKYEPPEGEFS